VPSAPPLVDYRTVYPWVDDKVKIANIKYSVWLCIAKCLK